MVLKCEHALICTNGLEAVRYPLIVGYEKTLGTVRNLIWNIKVLIMCWNTTWNAELIRVFGMIHEGVECFLLFIYYRCHSVKGNIWISCLVKDTTNSLSRPCHWSQLVLCGTTTMCNTRTSLDLRQQIFFSCPETH